MAFLAARLRSTTQASRLRLLSVGPSLAAFRGLQQQQQSAPLRYSSSGRGARSRGVNDRRASGRDVGGYDKNDYSNIFDRRTADRQGRGTFREWDGDYEVLERRLMDPNMNQMKPGRPSSRPASRVPSDPTMRVSNYRDTNYSSRDTRAPERQHVSVPIRPQLDPHLIELIRAASSGDLNARREIWRDGDEKTLGLHLLRTVFDNDLVQAQSLLDLGASVNAPVEMEGVDESGTSVRAPETPLSLATKLGLENMMELLLKYGASLRHPSDNRLMLDYAICYGHLGAMSLLIAQGTPVDGEDIDEVRPLARAARQSNLGALKLLLEAGADPNAMDRQGRTATHVAATVDPPVFLEALVQHKADMSLRTYTGDTIMHYACLGSGTCVQYLLDMKALLDESDKIGDTPLMIAASRGRVNIVNWLLEHGADPNHEDHRFGNGPLMMATFNNRHSCAQSLLAAGADIHKSTKLRFTPLFSAAFRGHASLCELFLENGADPDFRPPGQRYTPAFLAAMHGHFGALKALIDGKADLSLILSGNSILSSAIAGNNIDCVRLLLESGADTYFVNQRHGNTLLHMATVTASPNIVQLFLDFRADPNMINKRGNAPLHLAIWKRKYLTVMALLAHGADIDRPDSRGNTPLHLAALYDCHAIARELVARGADRNVTNREGLLPQDIAGRHNFARLENSLRTGIFPLPQKYEILGEVEPVKMAKTDNIDFPDDDEDMY